MKNELPIEKQVCTLEQAQAIAEIFKKAGIDAPGSSWTWVVPENRDAVPFIWMTDFFKREQELLRLPKEKVLYPSYSGCELGALLPGKLTVRDDNEVIHVLISIVLKHSVYTQGGAGIRYASAYWDMQIGKKCIFMQPGKCKSVTDAEAKANLAIHLLKGEIIKPEDFCYA